MCVVVALQAGESAAAISAKRLNVHVDGDGWQGNVLVNVTRVNTVAAQPYVLLLHGRAANSDERKRMGRAQYPNNEEWLARKGFTVVTPTRIGYGETGGPDLEYSGDCTHKNYEAVFMPASLQLRAVLAELARLKLIKPDKGWVLGDSTGGLIAIYLASYPLPGQQFSISFSGGDGGDPVAFPDNPCQPERLSEVLGRLGKTAKLPTLWLYSKNDRLFGADWPKRWFAAYEDQELKRQARFVGLPADKNNGHFIFSRNPLAWQPVVLEFVQQHGFN